MIWREYNLEQEYNIYYLQWSWIIRRACQLSPDPRPPSADLRFLGPDLRLPSLFVTGLGAFPPPDPHAGGTVASVSVGAPRRRPSRRLGDRRCLSGVVAIRRATGRLRLASAGGRGRLCRWSGRRLVTGCEAACSVGCRVAASAGCRGRLCRSLPRGPRAVGGCRWLPLGSHLCRPQAPGESPVQLLGQQRRRL
jgi:hypothetical protein